MSAAPFADLQIACPDQSEINSHRNAPVTSPPRRKAFPPTPEISPQPSTPQQIAPFLTFNDERREDSLEPRELIGLGISMNSLAEAVAPPPLALPDFLSFTQSSSLPQSTSKIDSTSSHLSQASSSSCLSEAEVAFASISSSSTKSSQQAKQEEAVDMSDNGIHWNIEAFDVGNLLNRDLNAIEEEPEEPETSESMYSTSSAPRSFLSRLTIQSRNKTSSSSGDLSHDGNDMKVEKGQSFKYKVRKMLFRRVDLRK